jgi:hypothetical protein
MLEKVMSIQKEREAFEQLPAVAKLIKTNDVWWSDVHGDYFGSDHELDCWIDGAWAVWQSAKSQAVPKVKLSRCVTLTCAQLREAFNFGAPDDNDQEQLETEMTIAWSDQGHSGKGYYCYYSELPEEGAIFLDKVVEAQEQSHDSK